MDVPITAYTVVAPGLDFEPIFARNAWWSALFHAIGFTCMPQGLNSILLVESYCKVNNAVILFKF